MICKTLGFRSDTSAITTRYSELGNTANDYILADVNCNGWKTQITQCRHRRFEDNCSEKEVAGVVCFDSKSVALIGGQNEGVVHALGFQQQQLIGGINESAVVCNLLFGKDFDRNIAPAYATTYNTAINQSQ